MNRKVKKVLIFDFENWDTLVEVPYLFHKAGALVHVYGRKDSWLMKSRYPDACFIAPDTEKEYIATVRTLIETEAYDWIVPGDETVLRSIAKLPHDDVLVQKISPVLKPENRMIIGSKAELSRACERYGISTPAFAIYNPGDDVAVLTRKLSFPVLIKIDQSQGGAGIFYCTTNTEVKSNLDQLSGADARNVVLQSYISGKNIAIESIYTHGQLIAYSYAEVTKTLGNEFGISSERNYTHEESVRAVLEKIGSSFGVHGFCSMTLMYDGQTYFLVETDFRPQIWYSLANSAGIDFSKAIQVYFDTPAGSMIQVQHNPASEVSIRHFSRDLVWCLQQGKYEGIWKWLINADGRWKALPWHDPYLIFYLILKGIAHIGKRMMGKVA